MTGSRQVPLGHHVIHVHDHWDAHAARATLNLASDRQRVLVVHVPSAGPQQKLELIEELATALGHTPQADLDKVLPPAERSLDALIPSLLGYRPTDLIIHRAHWLPADVLQTFIATAASTNSRVWLTSSPPVRAPAARLIASHAHPDDTIGWAEFEQLWAARHYAPAPVDPADHGGQAASAPHFPAVPASHFTLFRHRAAQLLSPHEMAAVDDELSRAAHHAATQLADDLTALGTATDGPHSPQHEYLVEHHAQRIWHPDAAVALTRLRGVQIGLFHRGWHLDVNLTRYLDAHAAARPVPSDHLAVSLRRLLRRRDPNVTAAALLTLLGIPRHQLPGVQVADIAVDGSALRQLGRWTRTPVEAHRHLAAVRAARHGSDAGPGDPLCTWPHHPPYPRHIREATADVLQALGVATATDLIHGIDPGSRRTPDPLQHLGFMIANLPDAVADTYAGPAPRSSRPSGHIGEDKRVTPDPGHGRRLTGIEATVLRAAVLDRPTSASRIPAVDRANINLRAAGLVTASGVDQAVQRSLQLR